MSIYHLNNVTSLAWFSSAAHFGILGVPKTNLYEHPAMRNWQANAMFSLFIMLLIGLLLAWADADDSTVPPCCFFHGGYIKEGFRKFSNVGHNA